MVQASLKAGVGYAFVVDGVGGESGRYTIRYCPMALLLMLCSCPAQPFPLCPPLACPPPPCAIVASLILDALC